MSHNFQLNVETSNATGDVLAVYFQVRKGKASRVQEFEDGKVFVNRDRKGRLLGIEMLAPCRVAVLDRIAAGEPVTKRFLRLNIPRQMALT